MLPTERCQQYTGARPQLLYATMRVGQEAAEWIHEGESALVVLRSTPLDKVADWAVVKRMFWIPDWEMRESTVITGPVLLSY